MKELPNDELGILVRLVKDGVALLVKDNPTLRGEVYQALDSLARAATTNLALQEPITQSLKSFDNSLSAQGPVAQEPIDPCRFCDPSAVVGRYDQNNFGNEHVCASCAKLVDTESKHELVERSVDAYFTGHPHHPKTEATRSMIRKTSVEPDHKEFWQLTELNGRVKREVATAPIDKHNSHNRSQQTPMLVLSHPLHHTPQKRLQASITGINDCRAVLLVDGDQGVTSMLKQRFEQKRFLVRSACDAENGRRVYESSGPFVLVMVDVSLPNHGGVELAKAIRQNDPSQILVMTAFAYQTEEEVERPQELMDIQVLTDVRQLPSVIDQIRPWANRDEVEQAIDGLTDADLCRIRWAAERVGLGSSDYDWEDLLSDTLLRTLTGADDAHNGRRKGIRRYDKRIDFVKFLIWAMRGMDYNNKKKSKEQPEEDEFLEEQARRKEGKPEDKVLVDLMKSEERARQQTRILAEFRDDLEATMVLQGFFGHMNKAEIMVRHSLSPEQFATIVKRIAKRFPGLLGKDDAAIVKRILRLLGRDDNRKGEEHDNEEHDS